MPEPTTIGFLGDIHCGSTAGLWPISELGEGRHPGVRYLMECWAHLVESWPELDLLCLMGDLIDGKQHKNSGTGVFTTNLGEQATMAAEILKPIAKKSKRIIRVWGTPYHESFDDVLKIVDKDLGIETVKQVMDIRLGKYILNIAHHPASGAAIYQGTVADREGLWSMIASHDKKTPDPRWLIRAHKHNWFHIETRTKDVIILPCWQLPTAHAIKQNYWRFQPDIGGVLMLKDELSESGYRFVPHIYDNPINEVLEYDSL